MYLLCLSFFQMCSCLLDNDWLISYDVDDDDEGDDDDDDDDVDGILAYLASLDVDDDDDGACGGGATYEPARNPVCGPSGDCV